MASARTRPDGARRVSLDFSAARYSATVKQALTQWADAFDKQYSLDDPYNALNGIPLDWQTFKQEGGRIYRMLCDEIGDRYSIIYNR